MMTINTTEENMEPTEITSTHEMADCESDGGDYGTDVRTDMVATTEPPPKGISFHVSMRNYTQNDMEALIVEAAAYRIVGQHKERELAKLIEQRCIDLVKEKATRALENVSSEIIDQPITPSFGNKKPITMRELIGLTGREYLTQPVDSYGRAKGDKDYESYRGCTPRMQYVVEKLMRHKFETEIEKETNDFLRIMRDELKKEHAKILEKELARFRSALVDATGKL